MSRNERSQWFLNRWARPADQQEANALGQLRQSSASVQFSWEPLGPFNVAGRSTSLAVDPRDHKRVWLGTAGGGLWLTEDGGESWNCRTDYLSSQSIGAIALDPVNPDIVYLGTGEANLTLDSYPGSGIYRGDRNTAFFDGDRIGSTGGGDSLPNRIGVIALNPFEPGHILIGSASMVDEDTAGLHVGRARADGGFTWEFISGFAFQEAGRKTRVDGVSGPYRCHSVLFHPAEEGVVFAALHLRGWRSGIYRSDDGGNTWAQLQLGLPSGERFGRTSLAVGHAGGKSVIWAYAAHAREGILGVFRSSDLGDSWQSVGGNHFASERSGAYSNCIAVHPGNPEWAICGGRDLHLTRDGGATWQQITDSKLPEGDPHYAPGEHHALAITPDGCVYDANDGGFQFSHDFGHTWQRRKTGMATTMLFKLDVAAGDPNVIVGGFHHDGVLLHRAGDSPGWFSREVRGEGGWVLIDPHDPAHIFASSPGVNLHRHTAAEGWSELRPGELTSDETAESWLPVIAMDGDKNRAAPRPLLLGTTRIWKSSDDGETWRPVSVELDGSPVSAIHITRDGSCRVYAGTEWGAVFVSNDGGNTWSENLAGIDLPNRYITRIDTRPANGDHVLVSIGPTPPTEDLGIAAYAHLYLSTDSGRTWRGADPELSLPDVPHNCVVFDADVTPFVGTDFGVYRGAWQDDRQNYTWDDISGDLPKAFVMDLVVHPESGTLTAATYGRGIFRHKLGSETSLFRLMLEAEAKSG